MFDSATADCPTADRRLVRVAMLSFAAWEQRFARAVLSFAASMVSFAPPVLSFAALVQDFAPPEQMLAALMVFFTALMVLFAASQRGIGGSEQMKPSTQ